MISYDEEKMNYVDNLLILYNVLNKDLMHKSKFKAFKKFENDMKNILIKLYCCVFNNFEGWEHLNNAYIIFDEKYVLFSYCNESYPLEEDELLEQDFIACYNRMLFSIDFREFYFIGNDTVEKYYIENKEAKYYKINCPLFDDFNSDKSDSEKIKVILKEINSI